VSHGFQTSIYTIDKTFALQDANHIAQRRERPHEAFLPSWRCIGATAGNLRRLADRRYTPGVYDPSLPRHIPSAPVLSIASAARTGDDSAVTMRVRYAHSSWPVYPITPKRAPSPHLDLFGGLYKVNDGRSCGVLKKIKSQAVMNLRRDATGGDHMEGTDADLVATHLDQANHQADVYVRLRQYDISGKANAKMVRKSLNGATA